jgi:predicted PurR-regulated permease PerM
VIGHTPQAIGLLLYSIIITTNVDNLVRLILQKKLADVHPLITIFGVILGIHLFGFIGIILGPLIISYFFILIEFYRKDKIEMQEIEIMGS